MQEEIVQNIFFFYFCNKLHNLRVKRNRSYLAKNLQNNLHNFYLKIRYLYPKTNSLVCRFAAYNIFCFK